MESSPRDLLFLCIIWFECPSLCLLSRENTPLRGILRKKVIRLRCAWLWLTIEFDILVDKLFLYLSQSLLVFQVSLAIVSAPRKISLRGWISLSYALIFSKLCIKLIEVIVQIVHGEISSSKVDVWVLKSLGLLADLKGMLVSNLGVRTP